MSFVTDSILSIVNRSSLNKPSLTNQYQVNLSGFAETGNLFATIRERYDIDRDWVINNIGILCTEATLPTSSFATSEVKDNFQGINQQFAHTRLYVDSDFTFYVDRDYNTLKFFEGWMDFISGGAYNKSPSNNFTSEEAQTYYRRFNYPQEYKAPVLEIIKFERSTDNNNALKYKFFNAFPKSVGSMSVSYGQADLLKVTVTFAYDRYLFRPCTFVQGNS